MSILSSVFPKSKGRKNKNIFTLQNKYENKPNVVTSYIKIFLIMKNKSKTNIIGILCIMFYKYLISIRYYSKLVKLGANIWQFFSLYFCSLSNWMKTYHFVFFICLVFFLYHLGRFLYLCRTTLFLTSWNQWLTMHQQFSSQIIKTY